MNCSPFDLRDYFFHELSAAERKQVEAHLAACAGCRDDVASLGMLRTAMMTVRDEEPPRRIAFVSDKVFEPRWWQTLWNSAPRLGFLSAAMLAFAILIHAWTSSGKQLAQPVAAIDRPAMEAEIDRRVHAAVQKVAADLNARHELKMQQVAAKQRLLEQDYRATMIALEENFQVMRKRNALMFTSASMGAIQ